MKHIKEVKIPADFRGALAASPRAKATWDGTTPIARRDWVLWIGTGRLAETRGKRIKKAISMLSSGKRRVCCFGGYAWIMKTDPELVRKTLR